MKLFSRFLTRFRHTWKRRWYWKTFVNMAPWKCLSAWVTTSKKMVAHLKKLKHVLTHLTNFYSSFKNRFPEQTLKQVEWMRNPFAATIGEKRSRCENPRNFWCNFPAIHLSRSSFNLCIFLILGFMQKRRLLELSKVRHRVCTAFWDALSVCYIEVPWPHSTWKWLTNWYIDDLTEDETLSFKQDAGRSFPLSKDS